MAEIRAYKAILAANVRRIRDEKGFSPAQLAERMRHLGLDRWTRATVVAVETERRDLSLGEALLLQLALVTPLLKLVDSHGDPVDIEGIVLAPGFWPKFVKEGPAEEVKGLELAQLRGINVAQRTLSPLETRIVKRYGLTEEQAILAALDRYREPEFRVASNLNVAPLEVAAVAYALWGRGLTEEREARVTRTGVDASDRMRAAHVTRGLQKEIAQKIRRRKS